MVEISLVQSILGEIKEQYFYHGQRVEQLKLEDYPFSCCSTLLSKLEEIDRFILQELDGLEAELIALNKKQKTPSMKTTLEDIQRYGDLVSVLHHILTYFEVGHRQNLSEGMAVPIKNVLNRFDKKSDFVLVPIFEFNYMYVDLMQLLRTALGNVIPNKVELLLSDMPSKYATFGFPIINKKNIIANTILAHEVGHFADDVACLSTKVLKKITLDKRKIDRIISRLDKASFDGRKEVSLTEFLSPSTLKANITQLAVDQISQWVEELVADAIAFHLFGPVFLNSMSMFLLSSIEIDEVESEHPPPRMRIQLLIEEFKEKDYARILPQIVGDSEKKTAFIFIQRLMAFESLIKELNPAKLTDFQGLVMDAVQAKIPEIKEVVDNYMKPFDYTLEQFKNEVFQLSTTLSYVVPPAEVEVGKPALPISILNAGLLYKMLSSDKMCELFGAVSTEQKLVVTDKLHALVLKALELSDIESQMKPILGADKS